MVGLPGTDAWNVTASEHKAGLVFQDPEACARRVVEKLRAEDAADVYVCLSHTGVNRGDRELAAVRSTPNQPAHA